MRTVENSHDRSIYTQGLRFTCTRCGKCCTGFPGVVYLSESDIKNISQFLSSENTNRGILSQRLFIKKYTIVVSVLGEKRLSLIEKPNYDCIFWDKSCTIYPVRPYQCRAFPFWKKHLVSWREWNKLMLLCPGIGKGRLYPRHEIERISESAPRYSLDTFSAAFVQELL